MKKELFDFFESDLQFIRGVGPVLAARLDEILGGRKILDFLLHKPSYVRNRDVIDSVSDAESGDTVTIKLSIQSHKPGGKFKGRKMPTRIVGWDANSVPVNIQFFNSSYLDYWLNKLPIGEVRLISGKLDISKNGNAVINHPDFVEPPEFADKIPNLQVVYPSGAGISQKIFTNIRNQIFDTIKSTDFSSDSHMTDFLNALNDVHFAKSSDELLPNADAVRKLAYLELLAHQMAIAVARNNRKSVKSWRGIRDKKYDLMDKFYSALPYSLTNSQKNSIEDIINDLNKSTPMMRLIQGDVGSGKTSVAAAAAVYMAERGGQTVLLAPTDTLAMQHFAKLKPLFDGLGLHCDILTGRDKGVLRREKLISIKSGRTRLLIGTHAVFSDDVIYKDLGLVIIDEQHRFGVAQRQAICNKGNNPDVLALSATPIPRTLSMTVYGDMDVSIINEKPAGRLPIITTKLPADKIGNLVGRLKLQVGAGAKVFWVCPLVMDTENINMAAASARYDSLIGHFPNAGLVHGQMDKKSRDLVMTEFAKPESDMKLLVSTTVIEVGIDVPAASIIVIENAERFGLAALHQLRGRVGRGDKQSYCVLLYGQNTTPDGLKRLDILATTEDGFVIAEQDLMMRGVGELLGTKQSGWISYHFVDYREHYDLFKLATIHARDKTDINSDEFATDIMYIFGRTTELGA